MRTSKRRTDISIFAEDPAFYAAASFGVVLIILTGLLYAAAKLTGQTTGGYGLMLLVAAILGRVSLPALTWVLFGGFVIATIVIIVIMYKAVKVLSGTSGSRIDKQARYMAHGKDHEYLLKPAVTAKAQGLKARGGLAETVEQPGLIIGYDIGTNKELYLDWETVMLDISGPRTGKTVSRAIPMIVEAPGAVIATSNKNDLYQATKNARAKIGTVWTLDPQKVDPATTAATFYWDPLTFVTDVDRARILAQVFSDVVAAGSSGRSDPFFDNRGIDLLAGLLLAAQRGGYEITKVWDWLSNETDREPIHILTDCGDTEVLSTLIGIYNTTEKTRSGFFAVAQNTVSFLQVKALREWITSGWQPGAARKPEFRPNEFVRSANDTIYMMSRKGEGQATAIVTALTVALAFAAQEYASENVAGRVPVPIVLVLDEAANVCPWRDLPDKYSFYGSQGIIVLTILQSYDQGKKIWGAEGMDTLWTAANIKIYGGGSSDTKFLEEISKLVGTHYVSSLSRNSQGFGTSSTSTSPASQQDTILTVEDLAALPKGRLIILSNNNRATMARWRPWFEQKQLKELIERA